MKKNLLVLLLVILMPLFILTGCNKENNNDSISQNTIKIIIENEKKEELYNKEVSTDKTTLLDVLKENNEISLKYEDGSYGAYITSLMGIDQKTEGKVMYYWSYYIDEKYAEEGVSTCKITDGSAYKFVYEKYEN